MGLIIHFLKFPPLTDTTWGLPNRLLGPFTNTNFLAQSYFLILVTLVGLFVSHIQSRSKIDVTLIAVAIVLLSVVLFFTFNRSIWLAGLFSFPIIFSFWKKRAAITIAALMLLTIIVLYIGNIGNFSSRIHQTLNPTVQDDVVRFNLWQANLHIFKSNPIFGVGYYNNTRNIQRYFNELGMTEGTINTHAHNEVLSFLAGTGITGTILFLAIFYCFAQMALKSLKKMPINMPVRRGLLIGAFAIQPSFLIAGFADNNFEIYVARNFLVFSWALILYIYVEFKENSSLI
ncbi:O-antigen ligase family protein [Bdellovibrio bacteriovorus]|uniref:O-antigen ligase family protein n=1 Tax=Bdellovibrio bacteriovorus TaxID=959 RepID=UPI0035A6D5AF